MGDMGWCTDPYGVHEGRWLSDGFPMNLVSDDGTMSMIHLSTRRLPVTRTGRWVESQAAAS